MRAWGWIFIALAVILALSVIAWAIIWHGWDREYVIEVTCVELFYVALAIALAISWC